MGTSAWPVRGLKALALAISMAGAGLAAPGGAQAADMPHFVTPDSYRPHVVAPHDPGAWVHAPCGVRTDRVALFDRRGRPTVPARTPFFYCLTGYTLVAGDIPPPPEYCCR